MIVGEGFERPTLEAVIAEVDGRDWVTLAGRLDDDGLLLDAYRTAWVVAATSVAEGFGMTLTEAAACGTPAVASDIAGHRDAVVDGVSGLLSGARLTWSNSCAPCWAIPTCTSDSVRER